ncbi:hypothetical protein O3M35_000615 [Rhynocoris fuscipes]|uniref:FP protein C-terminal domain-containing protein n=1 Tax=Rhynocoris fuscipes TaxID=488301 RepID=A0AAW1DH40_9HEMI
MSMENQLIFKATKDMQKRGHLKYVWFKNGKVLAAGPNIPTTIIPSKESLSQIITYSTDSSEFESDSERKSHYEKKRRDSKRKIAERSSASNSTPEKRDTKKSKETVS